MKIILLTGFSGTGKSTVAKAVSERQQVPCLSEREIARQVAAGRGFRRGRECLRALGWPAFSAHVRSCTVNALQALESTAASVILDGVYDYRLPDALQDIFPSAAHHTIVCVARRDIRIRRMAERLRLDSLAAAEQEMEWLDHRKMLAGMVYVIARAAAVIENNSDVRQAEAALESFLDDHA